MLRGISPSFCPHSLTSRHLTTNPSLLIISLPLCSYSLISRHLTTSAHALLLRGISQIPPPPTPRGARIPVANDGKAFHKVTETLAVTHNNTCLEDEGIISIAPQHAHLRWPRKYNLDITLDSPEIACMCQRCSNFVPGLENVEYDADAPFVQGLRPSPGSNVRVEGEERRVYNLNPSLLLARWHWVLVVI